MSGYIYILTNSSFTADYLKIGKTSRSVQQRAKELSDQTGMPSSYAIAYSVRVPDCDKAEKIIHDHLKAYRVNQGREFFKLSLDQAIAVVWKIAAEQILYKLNVSEWELKLENPADETAFHKSAREARDEIRARVEAKDPNAWDPKEWENLGATPSKKTSSGITISSTGRATVEFLG